MGGPRASTRHQIASGKMCQECWRLIDVMPWGSPRLCDKCADARTAPAPTVHRVLMNFMLRRDWQISFLEEDCETTAGRRLTFADPKKILELARKGGADCTSDKVAMIEYGIGLGRGSVWLNLTGEQYKKLK